jgi:hypothetical protein
MFKEREIGEVEYATRMEVMTNALNILASERERKKHV